MRENRPELNVIDDESRRSFMKKGALASGAIALGAAGSGTAAAESSSLQQQPSQVLMFAYDYHPSRSIQVVNQLQQQTINTILGQSVGQNGNQIVSDPTEYNGYIVQYESGDGGAGEYTLAFSRDQPLSTDQSYQLTPGNATFFNSDINLLQVGVGGGGGGGGDGG